jgi:hypothetical protein
MSEQVLSPSAILEARPMHIPTPFWLKVKNKKAGWAGSETRWGFNCRPQYWYYDFSGLPLSTPSQVPPLTFRVLSCGSSLKTWIASATTYTDDTYTDKYTSNSWDVFFSQQNSEVLARCQILDLYELKCALVTVNYCMEFVGSFPVWPPLGTASAGTAYEATMEMIMMMVVPRKHA